MCSLNVISSKVPVVIVNARISDRSLPHAIKSFGDYGGLFLRMLTVVFAQLPSRTQNGYS